MPSPAPNARRYAARAARAAAAVVAVLVPLGLGGPAAAALGASGNAPRAAAANGAPLAALLPLHARLASSVPEDGSTVGTVDEVVLTFSEEVNPSFVAVTVEGPGGNETDGTAAVEGRDVTQPLVADLGAGEHAVTFRVVSADGHPVSGTVTFTTTGGASAQASPGATASPVPSSPDGSATLPASPEASPPASADATGATSSEGSWSTSWAMAAIAALLLLVALAGALFWRSRRHRSGIADSEEPA